MASPQKFDYDEVDRILQTFLESRDYEVEDQIGQPANLSHTYKCSNEGMPFMVKLAVDLGEAAPRVKMLQNEVAALLALWEIYPEGETKSFLLPPGAEDIFEEEFEGYRIYGYSRFWLDGKVLGKELRAGREEFKDWVDRYVAIIKEIDSLPELKLPRTEEKKDSKYSEIIPENAEKWLGELKSLQKKGRFSEEFVTCSQKVVGTTKDFFAKNRVVTGTVHRQLHPDHLVMSEMSAKPYIVNFGTLCQCYPRFWDVGGLYAWVVVHLGNHDTKELFWDKVAQTKLKKKEIDYLRVITNALVVGDACTYATIEETKGKVGITCDVFV